MDQLTDGADAAMQRPHRRRTPRGFWRLTLAAIGVVYGDIGTSPLYAFRESIAHVARAERRQPARMSSAFCR